MATMNLAGARLGRQRRVHREVMRPAHVALRRRPLVLLDGHDFLGCKESGGL
jgi:hypothetical protein